MAQNRLKLDFSLVTNTERSDFVKKYLTSETFQKIPPTEDELSTIADYILWGKDPVTGKNAKQDGLDLRTKHGTWDDSPVDSLDQLLEQPTFNEASLSPLGSTQFRTKKEVFSREEALQQAPPLIKETLTSLFREIDRLELCIALYELAHGKRTKEIRPALLKQFSEEELCTMRERITHWNQYLYLKKRHQLVDMRREQYTLRDSYRKVIFSQGEENYQEPVTYDYDVDIEVLPLGLMHKEREYAQVFRAWRELDPNSFSNSDLRFISNLYWKK